MRGWFREPYRHSLASRGIKTKYMTYGDYYAKLLIEDRKREFNKSALDKNKDVMRVKSFYCPKCNSQILDPYNEGRYFICPYCHRQYRFDDLIVKIGWSYEPGFFEKIPDTEDLMYGKNTARYLKYGDWISKNYFEISLDYPLIHKHAFCPLCDNTMNITKEWTGDNKIRCQKCHTSRSWKDYLVWEPNGVDDDERMALRAL